MQKIKIFCFPYAGGSAVIFNNWKPFFDSRIEFVPVELAGRGKRINESLYPNVSDAIDDVFEIIKPVIGSIPYALYGHSMGGMISYELAQRIVQKNLPPPVHLFISGRGAPHIIREDDKKYHLMSEEIFRKEIIELGGTPPEFFEHPELIEVFLPMLRNDFRLAETELNNGEINPLNCNITAFFGEDEDLTSEQCLEWEKHTKKTFKPYYFKGGHFFIHNEIKQIVGLMNSAILDISYV